MAWRFPVFPLVLGCVLAATSLPAGAARAGQQGGQHGGLMGTVEFPSTNLAALPQWTRILDKMPEQRKAIARCDADPDACPSSKAIAWRAKIQELRTRDRLVQLIEINRFINTWSAKTDAAVYGTVEYWASPLEFLERSGDSEDFAIMKFYSLRELGFANDQLRIVIAMDVLSNRRHSFAATYYDGKVYVLDNVSDTVLTQEHSKYYVPTYSVNETTRWAHVINRSENDSKSAGAN